MKNWKVLITICVLGCTRICAQETGANDTVSRHPLTHGVGIDFRPVYLIPTNEFFAGENAAWQPLRKSVSAHLKYSFRFHPDSRYGKLYPHTYQGIGVSYHSFFDKAEIGTPVAVYAFQGSTHNPALLPPVTGLRMELRGLFRMEKVPSRNQRL